jgi:hypothetical protein
MALLTSVRRCRRPSRLREASKESKPPWQAGAYEGGGKPPHSKWAVLYPGSRQSAQDRFHLDQAYRTCYASLEVT